MVDDSLSTHGTHARHGQRSQEWGAAYIYYGSVKQNDQTAVN